MILTDTSVWVDYLRAVGSRADDELTHLMRTAPHDLVTADPVTMELLAGPTDEFTARRIAARAGNLPHLPFDARSDFRDAAAIQRACRRNGRTIRNMVDCLIAAIALRHDVTLLHKDVDFEVIAEVTGLKHESLREPE